MLAGLRQVPNTKLPWHCPLRVVCVAVALLVSGNQSRALERPEPVTGFVGRTFTVEDGLSSNNVNALLQTRDGFLWIGTQEGLLRFDGRHFTPVRFLPQASPILVNALVEAPDGAVWVGTQGGLARIPRGGSSEFGHTVSSLYHPGSGEGDSVQCLHFSRDGDLWVGTHTGLYRFKDGRFSTIIPELWTSRVEEAANGNLLVITSKGFVEWDGKQIIRHPDLPARLGVIQHGIFQVIEDQTGTRWYSTESGVARQVGGAIERLGPYGSGNGNPNVVYRLYDDQHGAVWFAQFGALYRVTAAGRQLVVSDLNAKYMELDGDGDLWVGTRRGLFRLKSQAVKMFTAADGLPSGVPMALLAASDGKLWVGSNCGGVSRFDGQRFHTYSEKDGLTANSCVYSLAEDRDHNIWAGTFGGGVFRFQDGRFIQVLAPDRLTYRTVTAIVPARDGPLWIAYSDGLDRMTDARFADSLPPMASRAIPCCLLMKIVGACSGSRLPRVSTAWREIASSRSGQATAPPPGLDDLALGKTGLETCLHLGPPMQCSTFRTTAWSGSMTPHGLRGWRNRRTIFGFAETASTAPLRTACRGGSTNGTRLRIIRGSAAPTD
jgi:ligand-binding sensor domain-containing protein